MPTPRIPQPVSPSRHVKSKWQPRYLQTAMRIFTPIDPCANFPKGSYHLVSKDAITAEEVTGRKGGP